MSIPVVAFGAQELVRKLNLPKETICCTDLDQLARFARSSPHILIVESSDPEDVEFSRVAKLASRLPFRLLVFTDATDDDTIERFALTNCMGVLRVGASNDLVNQAISALQLNEHWLPRRVISRLVRAFVSTHHGNALTKREEEIAKLISQRLNNQEIADKLSISRETVRWHVRTIYAKLGINDRRMLSPQSEQGLLSYLKPQYRKTS